MSDIVPAPKAVDDMLESVVPSSEGGKLTKPGTVVRSPVRAIRQHAALAIRRLSNLSVEQIELIRSSPEHMKRFDELIESLSKDEGVGARRSAARLILARERMAHALMMDAMEKNVRVFATEVDHAERSGDEGLTPEQAIRMLSEMRSVKVTETTMQRTLEAQVG